MNASEATWKQGRQMEEMLPAPKRGGQIDTAMSTPQGYGVNV